MMRTHQKDTLTLPASLFQTARHIEKQHLQKIITTYLVICALSAGTIALSLALSSLYNEAISILLIPAVTISTWYGDGKSGILTSLLITGGFYYLLVYRFPHLIQVSTPAEIVILFFSSLLLCITIDKAKKARIAREFHEKEKTYAKLLVDAGTVNRTLREELKARDEFLSIVSHELKTPLTSMLLQLQTALYNISNVSLANFSVQNLMSMLQSAQEQSERLSKMINDLLNISLITTGRFDLDKEPVSLNKLTEDIIQEFKNKALMDGYTINFSADAEIVGYWDALRLGQVITNLLTNAIKYGNKKPINVHVGSSRGEALLEVTDHGIGIRPEQRRHIFDRFQRAVSSRRYQGFGVGLYITKQIITAHNGSIDVKSSRIGGTTFTVRLPKGKARSRSVKNKAAAKG